MNAMQWMVEQATAEPISPLDESVDRLVELIRSKGGRMSSLNAMRAIDVPYSTFKLRERAAIQRGLLTATDGRRGAVYLAVVGEA